jgi:glutamine---fructose-6-phosphate transaminase (isomerizing)
MLREIHEQPRTLAATLNLYIDTESRTFRPSTEPTLRWLRAVKSNVLIAASGSSRHAGLLAELTLEDLAGIPVDVEYASEYSYWPESAFPEKACPERSRTGAAVMVISQSGETADTLAALRRAILAGHQTLAITNVDNSTMANEATVSFPTVAGRERAIPATKSFTAQLLNLYLLSLLAAKSRNSINDAELRQRLTELTELPASIGVQLHGWEAAARAAARHYRKAQSFLFLGRGIHYPIAREGALKLKESAYLHAEGYPSGELKHGPSALVADSTPLVMIATVDTTNADSILRYEKIVQLMRDMRARGANILAIANTGDELVESLATRCIFVDEMRETLLAISEIIPLQMFSYFMAVQQGIDVDCPRSLTKAVLAE